MTRVDFYILQADQEQARYQFVARLCEKACRQNFKVLILAPTEQVLATLDDLLWTFRPESFVPHSPLGPDKHACPVALTLGQDDSGHHDLLINLDSSVPRIFSRFQRLAEVVVQSPAILQATREHYGFYKDRGYPVYTHKLPS